MVVSTLSIKTPGMRYYSKQFQAALLYVSGSLVVAKSGDMAGVILILLALALAYRYSYLHALMVFVTAGFNCLMVVLYAIFNRVSFVDIIHELIFIFFSYGVVFIIFVDYTRFLNRKIFRLNKELDIARGNCSIWH